MSVAEKLPKSFVESVGVTNFLDTPFEREVNPQIFIFNLPNNLDFMQDKFLQILIKFFIERFFTVLGIIVISPLLAAIAVAVKLDSKGPVIFKQKRVGKNGKEFYMYKFRSMRVNAEDNRKELDRYNETNELMFKMTNDPRVTRVGKFIRKYSLDEFPQLINVLKGEMSIIGFRPPLPEEVKKYKPWHHRRFVSYPGLTGPWQVGGRSKIKDFDEVVRMEYEYAKNWSLFADLMILLKTIPVVLFGKDSA